MLVDTDIVILAQWRWVRELLTSLQLGLVHHWLAQCALDTVTIYVTNYYYDNNQ